AAIGRPGIPRCDPGDAQVPHSHDAIPCERDEVGLTVAVRVGERGCAAHGLAHRDREARYWRTIGVPRVEDAVFVAHHDLDLRVAVHIAENRRRLGGRSRIDAAGKEILAARIDDSDLAVAARGDDFEPAVTGQIAERGRRHLRQARGGEASYWEPRRLAAVDV